MEEVMEDIEVTIEQKIASLTWKIGAAALIPILGFATLWGSVYSQTQANSRAIENTVLTVKDKENLENQIKGIATGVDELKSDIKDIKNALK